MTSLALEVDLAGPGRVAEEAEAAAGRLAGGLEQVDDQAPAAAVAGRLDEADVSDGDRLVVEVDQPAARPERGRAVGGRARRGPG